MPLQNVNLQGALIENLTGAPSNSWGTAATTAKLLVPNLEVRQSGIGPNYSVLEQVMENTIITDTSTELNTPEINKIDLLGQGDGHGFPCVFTSPAEGAIPRDTSVATSASLETVIFDLQLEPSVDTGDGLMPSVTTQTLATSAQVSNMVNNILPAERPISPSDFLVHQPSVPQLPSELHLPDQDDFQIPPDWDELIASLLSEGSEDTPATSSTELDVNLYSQFDQDPLGDVMQQCGIDEEELLMLKPELEDQTPTIVDSFPDPVPTTHPTCDWSTNVGPVRVHRERRARRTPARYRETVLGDSVDSHSTRTVRRREEVMVLGDDETSSRVEETPLNKIQASTSEVTTTARKRGRQSLGELTDEEKYRRNRIQNNIASRKCRQKRRQNLIGMENTLNELTQKNVQLQAKVKQLTSLRDQFQTFVNDFFSKHIASKK